MTLIVLYGLQSSRVRIWRTETVVRPSYDNTDLRVVVAQVLTRWQSGGYLSYEAALNGVLEALTNMPRVSAVELTGPDGCGVVVYEEWP